MIVVTAPDGSAVNFPDGTSEGVINQAMTEKFSPEPENSLAGSAKAIGSGLAEGAVDLLGFPADAANLLTKGADWAAGKITGETTESKPGILDKIGSEGIKKFIESYTGEFYKPQTTAEKFLHTPASFGAAALAGPGGIARRAATQAIVPGVVSEAAGQLTEGTESEPYARIAGALTGAVGASRIAQTAAKPSVAAVPTKAELDSAKSAGYKSPAIDALEIDPKAVGSFVDKVTGDLKKARFSEKQSGGTYETLETLRKAEFGTNHKMADFDSTRQMLNKIAGNMATPIDAEAARRVIKAIDAFTLRVPQSAVIAGDARAAGRELFQARGNAAAGFRSERVMQALEKAINTAGATHSGGNLDNEVRKQIRNMLNNPKQMRGFSAEEKKALEKIARGNLASNTIRKLGKLLGGGGGLGQMISGGAGGAMFGWPGMVALPMAGMGANKLGSALTMRQLNRADELVRSRSPLYGPANQQAYLQSLQGPGILGQLPPPAVLAAIGSRAMNPQLVNQ